VVIEITDGKCQDSACTSPAMFARTDRMLVLQSLQRCRAEGFLAFSQLTCCILFITRAPFFDQERSLQAIYNLIHTSTQP
jgi:hypothetical protein